MSGRGGAGPAVAPVSEAPPAAAAAVFGDRLTLAARYAELLCADAVERGLIGPREPARIWTRHILNGAALAPLVPAAARVLDLGSGAGIPGIPLAIARPDLSVTLVESMSRRTAFLHDVVAALGLDVRILTVRAEHADAGSADVVVARAVAPLARLVPLAVPLLCAGGRLLAIKGSSAATEVTQAQAAIRAAGARVAGLHQVGEGAWATVVVDVRARSTAGRMVSPPRKRQDGPRRAESFGRGARREVSR